MNRPFERCKDWCSPSRRLWGLNSTTKISKRSSIKWISSYCGFMQHFMGRRISIFLRANIRSMLWLILQRICVTGDLHHTTGSLQRFTTLIIFVANLRSVYVESWLEASKVGYVEVPTCRFSCISINLSLSQLNTDSLEARLYRHKHPSLRRPVMMRMTSLPFFLRSKRVGHWQNLN